MKLQNWLLGSTVVASLAIVGFAVKAAQTERTPDEILSETVNAYSITLGETRPLEADEAILLVQRAEGGTTAEGDEVEAGAIARVTRVVKFNDGGVACYVITDPSYAISCVK